MLCAVRCPCHGEQYGFECDACDARIGPRNSMHECAVHAMAEGWGIEHRVPRTGMVIDLCPDCVRLARELDLKIAAMSDSGALEFLASEIRTNLALALAAGKSGPSN